MPDRETMLQLLRMMYRIRTFEERLMKFYDYRGFCAIAKPEDEAKSSEELLTCVGYDFASTGAIGGAVHLSIGQEAVSTGVCAHLRADDSAVSSHRSHGHALAKGCDPRRMLAELMGRETGLCRGFGGSMHLFSVEHGFLGGNGIVGGQVPIALGPAFAARYRGTDQVSVAFFGDGAANQGATHEAMNLAGLWKLPVIFVCENNLYANSTPSALSHANPEIAQRAVAYSMPGVAVDGQDVLAMYAAAGEAVERARKGDGPTLIEAKTYRFQGHCGVSAGHQNPEECARWMQRDPLVLLERRLREEGLADEAQLCALKDEAVAEIDDAEAFAVGSPASAPALVKAFVW
jgi:TPP-dependent pyruvate/acetoin dehydrogenase alpha subunit